MEIFSVIVRQQTQLETKTVRLGLVWIEEMNKV